MQRVTVEQVRKVATIRVAGYVGADWGKYLGVSEFPSAGRTADALAAKVHEALCALRDSINEELDRIESALLSADEQ